MLADAFGARGRSLAEDGLSLVDVEVELFNGNLLYHGLFRTEVGAKTNRISEPKPIEAFRLERDAQQANGRFLADMETVEINGVMNYIGIWRAGDRGRPAISALRDPEAFRDFAMNQASIGRFPTDLEPRVLPTEDISQPLPSVTTADLPGPPDWVSLEGPFGNRRVVVEFKSTLPEPGVQLTVHTDLLPILPRNADGNVVFPDNICGLRVFNPSSTVWEESDGTPIVDGLHLSHSSFSGLPLETEALSGIDFTGPMGACSASNDNWRFNWPLTSNGTGGPPNRRLIIENPSAVEFLNHNVPIDNPFGGSLKPKDYFRSSIMDLLEQIAKGFIEEGANNGYCSGAAEYMVAVCGEDTDNCPFGVDFDGNEIDFNASC